MPLQYLEETILSVINQTYQNIEYIILAVAHDEFNTFNFEKYHQANAVIFDVKAVVDRRWVDWRL